MIFFASSVSASSIYPIQELGSCRDGKECKLYCDIPQNSPACWSYNKYVINKNILGEETVNISYPINELGSCQSAQACFIYCSQPQNQSACLDYAKRNGLVKDTTNSADVTPPPEVLAAAAQELGCSSRESCMAVCNDQNNFEKCQNFAQKHNLSTPGKQKSGPTPEVVAKAKKELGCTSEISCMNLCNNPENSEICFEFAKKNELLAKEEIDKHDEYLQKREEFLTEAKKELGCDSPEICQSFCQNRENLGKCVSLASKYGLVPSPRNPPQNNIQGGIPSGEGITNPISSGQLGPGGCANEKECKEYCEKHPNDCLGFGQQFPQSNLPPLPAGSSAKIGQSFQPPQQASPKTLYQTPGSPVNNQGNTVSGDYLGPGGCKTEKECKAYCEKHPGDCPGFPKDQKAQTNSSPSARIAQVTPAQTGLKKGQKTETSKQNINPASADTSSPPIPLLTLPPLVP